MNKMKLSVFKRNLIPYVQARKVGILAGYQLFYSGTNNLVEETANDVFRSPAEGRNTLVAIRLQAINR